METVMSDNSTPTPSSDPPVYAPDTEPTQPNADAGRESGTAPATPGKDAA
jgi:hypothetical protein